MNKKVRFTIIALSFALVAAISFSVALLMGAATDGSVIKLVSLDYIENKLFPYIDDNDKVAKNEITIMKGQLLEAEKKIAELEDKLGSGGDYKSVTLYRSESLSLSSGCEIVVVSGRMTVDDGMLCDTTAGCSCETGDDLEVCHSYAAGQAAKVIASSGEVVILIRGEYTNG